MGVPHHMDERHKRNPMQVIRAIGRVAAMGVAQRKALLADKKAEKEPMA
jgi:hypothetical protein